MNFGEGDDQIVMDRGSNAVGIQSDENYRHENLAFPTILTDNTGSQVIPLVDSDASLSETATAGDCAVITESQMSSQHVESMIRSEAASMANRLGVLKGRQSSADKASGHSEVKRIVACELSVSCIQCFLLSRMSLCAGTDSLTSLLTFSFLCH